MIKLIDKNNFEIRGPIKVTVGKISKVSNYGTFKPRKSKLCETLINEKGERLELQFQDDWYIYIHAKDIVSTQWLLAIKNKIDKDFISKTYQDILGFDYLRVSRIKDYS